MVPLPLWMRIDKALSHHMIWLVLSALALGILLPEPFAPLRAFAALLMAIMTFCSSLSGGFRQIGHVLVHPLPTFVILLHIVMPTIGLMIGRFFLPHDPLFMTGIVLQLSISSAVSALMWVSTFGGNFPLCLAVILLDTLLSPVIIPLMLRVLIGSVVRLDVSAMMWDLVIMVAIPAVMAMLLSFFNPFVQFVNTIPTCVIGGICIALYGFIAVSGLKMLQKVDLSNNKNLYVVCAILVPGIGGLTLDFGYIQITAIATALILGILTNLLMSTKKDAED